MIAPLDSLFFFLSLGCGLAQIVDLPLYPFSQIPLGAPSLTSEYIRLSAYGVTSLFHEGNDVPKSVAYKKGNALISEREFHNFASESGIPATFFSITNTRKYSNQDNFLIDSWISSLTKQPIFTSFTVWDGHGSCGHLISELFRRSMMPVIDFELVDFLSEVSKEGSYLSIKENRPPRIASLLKNVFTSLQEQYMSQLLFIDDLETSFLGRAFSDSQRYDCNEAAVERSLPASAMCGEQSGATMSTVLIDHTDQMLYFGNVGDSPIFVKFAGLSNLSRIHKDHNMASREERDLAIARLRSNYYTFEKKETTELGCSFTWKSRGNPDAPPVSINLRKISNYYDFRMGALQMSRAMGHGHQLVTVDTTPYVDYLDMAEYPVEYLFVVTDGVTQQLLMYLVDHTEGLLAKHTADVWRYMNRSSNPSENDALRSLDIFGKAYERFSDAIEEREAAIVKDIIENHSDPEEVISEFVKLSRKYFNLESSDDSTGLLYRFHMESRKEDVASVLTPSINLSGVPIPHDAKLIYRHEKLLEKEEPRQLAQLKEPAARRKSAAGAVYAFFFPR